MKCTATLDDAFRTETVTNRGHRVVTDLPESQGGADAGPSGLELCGVALAGCITTLWAIVAKNSKLDYSRFEVELEAEKPQGAKTFASVRLVARVATEAPDDRVRRIFEKAVAICPVGVLFEQAGVRVEHRVERV